MDFRLWCARSWALAAVFLLVSLASVPVSAQPPPEEPPSILAGEQPQITSLSAPPATTAPGGAESDQPALKPTWETQRQAGTYALSIPAPRGQITDRHGQPLAQTRVGYNLAISFPTPLNFATSTVLSYAHQQIRRAEALLRRPLSPPEDALLVKLYKNRGMLPLDIAQDLSAEEAALIRQQGEPGLALNPVYFRVYPNKSLAAHVIGYVSKTGRNADGPIQDNDLLWPDVEGREGLEQTFNSQLTGKIGQLNITFNAQGQRTSEKIFIPPQPGYNVVSTIDLHIQQLAEDSLRKGAKRGALVVVDPNTGDVLALASWPTFDPNAFVPAISRAEYQKLQDDPNIPMIPRAFRSAYPPGSTFKVFVGVAALESGKIGINDEFSGPASYRIGNTVMRNWKKTDAGMLNFRQALEQSCDTWFYQVGIKTGAKPIIDWSLRYGFGSKTGLPLRAETEGRIPDDDYMKKYFGRKILDGDIANISIGQGAVLVTPLQMAEAIAAVANGGHLYGARLVQQIQTLDNKIVTAYHPRLRDDMQLDPKIAANLKAAMVDVVSGGQGTAHKAEIEGIKVAGKTGTAQWGPKSRERNAAWFTGFAPADHPQYAFAAVYESEIGESAHGGEYAAPLVAKVLKPLFAEQQAAEKAAKKAAKAAKKAAEDDGDDHDKPEKKPASSDDSSSDESN